MPRSFTGIEMDGKMKPCCSKGEPHDLDSFSRVMNVNAIGSFNVLRLAAMR